jgi:hypothetical protein
MSALDPKEKEKILEGLVNHKGKSCIYTGMICLEGYCNECNIEMQYKTVLNNSQSNHNEWRIQ